MIVRHGEALRRPAHAAGRAARWRPTTSPRCCFGSPTARPGYLAVSRSAWGRKGRIAIQIFGARGSILFDQERMNEVQLYVTSDRPTEQGFRTILAAPHHPPYDTLHPGARPRPRLQRSEDHRMPPADRLHRFFARRWTAARSLSISTEGYVIEQTVHAMARSYDDALDGGGVELRVFRR